MFFSLKKKPFTSFEILISNLLFLNLVHLLSVVPAFAFNFKENLPAFIIDVIGLCAYHLQCTVMVFVAVQRALMVMFPLKANLWLTKKKTSITVVCTYVIVICLAAICNVISTTLAEEQYYSNFLLAGKIVSIHEMIIIVASNILIICKMKQRRLNSDVRAAGKITNKTELLVLAMTLSSVVTYLVPIIVKFSGVRYRDVYFYTMTIDPITNAVVYILLKTSLFSSMKKTCCSCWCWIFKNEDSLVYRRGMTASIRKDVHSIIETTGSNNMSTNF